jgi:hypothetical protein
MMTMIRTGPCSGRRGEESLFMANGFTVEPDAVAGYGAVCGATAGDCRSIARWVERHAASDDHFAGGVLGELRVPVDRYASATASRLESRAVLLDDTSAELNRTAWLYTGKDALTEAMFRFDTPTYAEPTYRDFPLDEQARGRYDSADVTGPLDPPRFEPVDFAEFMASASEGNVTFEAITEVSSVLDQVAGFLGDIVGEDWSFDPMAEVMGKVVGDYTVGDWNVLRQKADALDLVGGAAETAAENLRADTPNEGNLGRLLHAWEGGAADAFHHFLPKLEGALRYEASLNRVIATIYRVVAELIAKVAETAVALVGEAIELLVPWKKVQSVLDEAKETLSETLGMVKDIGESIWVLAKDQEWNAPDLHLPGPGGQLVEDLQAAKGYYDEAKSLVDTLTGLPDLVDELITAAQDPVEALEVHLADRLNEQFAPIAEQIETYVGESDSQHKVDMANQLEEVEERIQDFGTVANAGALNDDPDETYTSGRYPRRN